jgi:putative transposase
VEIREKYECIYLRALAGGVELKKGLEKYVRWYNGVWPHQGLDNCTPDEVYLRIINLHGRLKPICEYGG